MKAVILAAGMGTRLRPLTNSRPKCLVEVHGKPIVQHQLESLANVGVAECILVTGYLSDQLREHFGREFCGVEISYVENERYAETNNLYSLWLAIKELDDDITLLEGDLIFEDALLEQLFAIPEPNVAVVDRYQPFMDGTVILAEGRVAKTMVLKKDQGGNFDYSRALKTVNIYRLSGKDLSHRIIPELTRYVVEEKTDQYYEAVFADLVSREVLELSILQTKATKWAEIDTIEDLKLAEKLFPDDGRAERFVSGIPDNTSIAQSRRRVSMSENVVAHRVTGGLFSGHIESVVPDQRD